MHWRLTVAKSPGVKNFMSVSFSCHPASFRGGRYGRDCLGKARFAQEHRPALCDVEFEELHFERKAAQRRGIEVSKQVGRHDHDTVESLPIFLQQFH